MKTVYYLDHSDEIVSVSIPHKTYDTYDQAYAAKREKLVERRNTLITELHSLNEELDDM